MTCSFFFLSSSISCALNKTRNNIYYFVFFSLFIYLFVVLGAPYFVSVQLLFNVIWIYLSIFRFDTMEIIINVCAIRFIWLNLIPFEWHEHPSDDHIFCSWMPKLKRKKTCVSAQTSKTLQVLFFRSIIVEVFCICCCWFFLFFQVFLHIYMCNFMAQSTPRSRNGAIFNKCAVNFALCTHWFPYKFNTIPFSCGINYMIQNIYTKQIMIQWITNSKSNWNICLSLWKAKSIRATTTTTKKKTSYTKCNIIHFWWL